MLALTSHFLGKETNKQRYWPMIKWSSGRRQKYVSTLIPCFASDRRKIFQEQQKDGKAKLKISGGIRRIMVQWDSAEKRLNSSGKIPRILDIVKFLKKSRKTWRQRTSSQKTSRTGSSSCQCSTTMRGKRMMIIVLRMPKTSGITQ